MGIIIITKKKGNIIIIRKKKGNVIVFISLHCEFLLFCGTINESLYAIFCIM